MHTREELEEFYSQGLNLNFLRSLWYGIYKKAGSPYGDTLDGVKRWLVEENLRIEAERQAQNSARGIDDLCAS